MASMRQCWRSCANVTKGCGEGTNHRSGVCLACRRDPSRLTPRVTLARGTTTHKGNRHNA